MKSKRKDKKTNLFNTKSKYLRNLSKRKEEGIRLLEEEKASLMVDKLLRNNVFIRDYSVFSQGTPINRKPMQTIDYLHFTPDVKLCISSQSERDYPDKYKKKDYNSDSFAQIYKKKNKLNKSSDHKYILTCKFPQKRSVFSNNGINVMKVTNLKFGIMNNNNNCVGSAINIGKHSHIMTSGTATEEAELVLTKSTYKH